MFIVPLKDGCHADRERRPGRFPGVFADNDHKITRIIKT